jgi:peptide/nickel transport system ATP-binding protein
MSGADATVPATPILETVGLVKHFVARRRLFGMVDAVRAVDGVSLRVARGETLAIVGESGCGKSTLGRLMLRLIEPTAGAVLYEGEDITGFDDTRMRLLRREMQIVFQDPFSSLNPRMTVGSIVGEPIWLAGEASAAERRDRIADLLATVGLRPDHAGRYPHEFSGGQRQRIGVARALASGPKLVIGDEPVSALDVSIQAQIVNLLEDLKGRFGLTLIVIAHDLAVIRHMSDRVGVMYLGELVELAPTDALYEAPLHPYTQALMAAIPVPSPRGRRPRRLIEGDVPSPANPPPGCRFNTRCPHARERCRVERPALAPVAGSGRAVACHFWPEIQALGAGPVLIEPEPSPARARRFALWRAARERLDAATTTITQEERP